MAKLSQLVRSATLFGYADLALSLGLDPATLLRQVGLSRRVLDDPEAAIPVERVHELLELSAKASATEDFGLRLAARRRLSNLGPISIVLREESTAMAALKTLQRYLRLINASLLTHIDQFPDLVVIREDVLTSGLAPTRQSVELAIGVMHRILSEIMGPGWSPRLVCFAHRAPKDLARHREFLGKHLEFNAEFNGIVCARADLEAQLPNTDADLARYARMSLDKALAFSQTSPSQPIRQVVAALLPLGRCTADQVAEYLGVNRRTIHRRLTQDGKTFRRLLNDVRTDFAARQLRDSDHSVTEVAHLLGFSDASAFAHWFKKQLGQSALSWKAADRARRL